MWDFFNEIISKQPQLANHVASIEKEFLLFLTLIEVLFIGTTFILLIFIGHRIAGPMYKLKKHLQEIRQGAPITPIAFRKGDYFPEVANEVSLFLDTMAQNQQKDFQFLDEVTIYLENLSTVIPDDKKPILNQISRRLSEIQSRYKKTN
jgi:hypothetical protein